MIEFDLNSNDAEALLRHAESFKPASGDPREDRRLESAMEALRAALATHLQREPADGL